MKNSPMTPTGIEPATFRFVAQYLNQCATAVPINPIKEWKTKRRTNKINEYHHHQQ
jgi:hypothetical protein